MNKEIVSVERRELLRGECEEHSQEWLCHKTGRFGVGLPGVVAMLLLWVGPAGFWAERLAAQQTEARADTGNEAAVPAAAVAPGAALPSVKEVVEKSERVLGGREAWTRATSRRMKGLYQSEDSSSFFAIEILQKSPNKSLTKITFPNGVVIREVCDGKAVWIEDAGGGYHEFTGPALATRLRQADLLVNLTALESAKSGTVKGIEKVGTQTAYVVEFSEKKNLLSRVYFDVNTGYAVHTEDVFTTPEGPYTVKFDLEDYREVEGLKFPFRIKRTEKGAVINIRMTQMSVNPVIDDSVFLKPESAHR